MDCLSEPGDKIIRKCEYCEGNLCNTEQSKWTHKNGENISNKQWAGTILRTLRFHHYPRRAGKMQSTHGPWSSQREHHPAGLEPALTWDALTHWLWLEMGQRYLGRGYSAKNYRKNYRYYPRFSIVRLICLKWFLKNSLKMLNINWKWQKDQICSKNCKKCTINWQKYKQFCFFNDLFWLFMASNSCYAKFPAFLLPKIIPIIYPSDMKFLCFFLLFKWYMFFKPKCHKSIFTKINFRVTSSHVNSCI